MKNEVLNYWRYVQTNPKEDCKNCKLIDKCTIFTNDLKLGIGDTVLVKNANYKPYANYKSCIDCINQNGCCDIDCINCKENIGREDKINRNLFYVLGCAKDEQNTVFQDSIRKHFVPIYYKDRPILAWFPTDQAELLEIYGVYIIDMVALMVAHYKYHKNLITIEQLKEQSKIIVLDYQDFCSNTAFLNYQLNQNCHSLSGFCLYNNQYSFMLPMTLDGKSHEAVIYNISENEITCLDSVNEANFSFFQHEIKNNHLVLFQENHSFLSQELDSFDEGNFDMSLDIQPIKQEHKQEQADKSCYKNLTFKECSDVIFLNKDKDLYIQHQESNEIYKLVHIVDDIWKIYLVVNHRGERVTTEISLSEAECEKKVWSVYRF